MSVPHLQAANGDEAVLFERRSVQRKVKFFNRLFFCMRSRLQRMSLHALLPMPNEVNIPV